MKMFDIHTADVQEACDYAVQKIVQQGKQCIDKNGLCLYYDGQGNHCAVGWLVQFHFLIEEYETIPSIIKNNMFLFMALQSFHDEKTIFKRKYFKDILEVNGIGTSGPHWQQWVDMGLYK